MLKVTGGGLTKVRWRKVGTVNKTSVCHYMLHSKLSSIFAPAADSGKGLQVLLWNGRLMQVPGDLAVWIPASHHERIVRELQQIPLPPCCNDNLLHVQSTMWAPYLYCTGTQCCPSAGGPCHCPIMQPWWPLRVPPTHVHGLREREGLERKKQQDRAELEKKVDLQLGELKETKEVKHETSSSSSSSLSGDEEAGAIGERSVSPLASTGPSPLDKLGPEHGRPAWRYWRRSHPEPQHRQPGIEYTQLKMCVSLCTSCFWAC